MENLPGYSAWFRAQKRLQRNGWLVILAAILSMLILGCLAEDLQGPRPVDPALVLMGGRGSSP